MFESQKTYYERRKEKRRIILKEIGIRTTKPKPQNDVHERLWQEEATRLWRLYGWFMEPDPTLLSKLEKRLRKEKNEP